MTHRADSGVRLVVAIADLGRSLDRPVPRQQLLQLVAVPDASLLSILGELRKRQIVKSRRGVNGGWVLARDAASITVGDVVRALEGPFATVGGRPATAGSDGVTAVWCELGDAMRDVLDRTTIADLVRPDDPNEAASQHGSAPSYRRGLRHVPAVDPVLVWGAGASRRENLVAAP